MLRIRTAWECFHPPWRSLKRWSWNLWTEKRKPRRWTGSFGDLCMSRKIEPNQGEVRFCSSGLLGNDSEWGSWFGGLGLGSMQIVCRFSVLRVVGFGSANATRGPRFRASPAWYYPSMYFFTFFTQRHTLHRLVFIPLHSYYYRARSLIVLCTITPYFGRYGAFIRFSSYFEFFLQVSPQSFGLPKTEVSPLRISYYFVSLHTNYLAIVSRYFKYYTLVLVVWPSKGWAIVSRFL